MYFNNFFLLIKKNYIINKITSIKTNKLGFNFFFNRINFADKKKIEIFKNDYKKYFKNNFFRKNNFNFLILSFLIFYKISKFKKISKQKQNFFLMTEREFVLNIFFKINFLTKNFNNFFAYLSQNKKYINKYNKIFFLNSIIYNDELLLTHSFFYNKFNFFKKIKTHKKTLINNKILIKNKKTKLFYLNYSAKNKIPLFFKNLLLNYSLFYFLNNLESLLNLFFKPLFLKFFCFKNFLSNSYNNLDSINYSIISFTKSYLPFDTNLNEYKTNLIPSIKFNYILKKKISRIFVQQKFIPVIASYYYYTLIRFLEYYSGKKACVQFNGFLNNNLNYLEKSLCLLWSQKVTYFRKLLGPRLFLNESIQIIYLFLKNKDPYLFSNWMVNTFYKISFWKYKTFLRYLKYVLRYLIWAHFQHLKVKGVKFQLKGKISVSGNSRTRTAFHYIGFTSNGTFNNKILYKLALVRSFTGVMGLKLWIVF